MWKKSASFLFLTVLLLDVFGQSAASGNTSSLKTTGGFDYGNSWYNSGLNYAKLLVWEDGVYRVSASDLTTAGFSLNGADPDNVHLFYRGQEQHIYVSESGGQIDFVEFYGKRNDGRVDSLMYRNPTTRIHGNDEMPNINTSLFSDTSAYFIYHDANPGLRFQDFNAIDYQNYSPESYFRYKSFHEFHPNLQNTSVVWSNGGSYQYSTFHVLNSYWITGEGYVGIPFSHNNRGVVVMPSPHAANLGNTSEYVTRVFGKSTHQHIFQLDINFNVIYTDTITDVYIKTRSAQFNSPLGNTTNFGFSALGTQDDIDYNNYCWSNLYYDRLFNMDGENSIEMHEWQDNNNSYFRFANASISSEGWVYDFNNHIRSRATASGDTLHVIIPGNPNSRNLFVVADSGIKSPAIVSPSLSNLTDINGGAPFVIISHKSLSASAIAYKNYRDTNTVNQLNTKIVYVDEIYNEFGYGSVTPWAIKRFCKYAMDNWVVSPKFFMLWGKGQVETRYLPSNLVPTAGYPPTDYAFVSDFDPFSLNIVPETPIGRVNVESNAEGMTYLNKVIEYEHSSWESWMKELVFLGGGDDATEQGPILSYLKDNYKPIAESAPMGGNVNYYQKFNTGEVTNSNMTATNRINAGASIIHFFGHSNANIYDVDIQEPVLYQNYGKYPFMVAFGCYGGNFAGLGKSFGERFVLEPNRGSIAYLANSTAGFLSSLGNFGNYLYDALLNTNYGDALGTCIQVAMQNYWNSGGDQAIVNHAKQMNLQGDPSVKLYSSTKPDLHISESGVFFDPPNFSAADSSFQLKVLTRNLGRVTQDSFFFSVRQLIPQSGGWITYPSIKHPPIVNQDTITLTIQNLIGSNMAGLNTFDIFADSTDVLDEYSENNNRLFFDQIIPGNVPAILYPYDFAVVKGNRVNLSASSYVMSNQINVNYIFEIDTTPTFNSPRWLSSGTISGTAPFANWDVPFDLIDSTVYYWRVRLRDVPSVLWADASFKYITGKEGWAQSRPPQFLKDASDQISMDEINREWNFEKYAVDLHAFVREGTHGNYRLANSAFSSSVPSINYNGLLYTSIRSKDLQPTVLGTVFGDWSYSDIPISQGDVITSILNTSPGDFFLMVSEGDPRVSSWNPALFNALALVGADTNKLRNIPPTHSFIVLGQKGQVGQGITITEPNVIDTLNNFRNYDLRKSLETNFERGDISSTPVGPASNWHELIWDWGSLDVFPQEDLRVSLYATRTDNTDSLIYSGLARGTYPLTAVDAARFPFMRLEAEAVDSLQLTAPQLEHWHVLYTPSPDVLIDPTLNWSFDRDSAMRGEDLTVSFTARNISEWDMDSLLVKFDLKDVSRQVLYSGYQRYAPVNALQSLQLNHTFSSNDPSIFGALELTIELNPEGDQPEQYHFNNLYDFGFTVLEDQINPILDVTVDGKHLMSRDIVSPDPEILIEINDENPFLAVNDTAYEIHFGLKTANPNNLPRIFIDGNPQMENISAQLPDNKAQLYFRPGTLADGDYTLRVQGFDQTGNASGKTEYEIDFTVVNASTLTDVLNYPNPFSTSTRFVYTLTGSEVPERFDIQIFTISGRLVKTIDLAGLDDVHIGKNISDFAWDGRDEYGDLLANGVYIYKVIARINGQDIVYRDEGVSSLFKNGFGKMYLMR